MLDERAPRLGRPMFESVWGLEATPDGTLALPEDVAADNPLLAVTLARFKEGCRLLEHAGEHADPGLEALVDDEREEGPCLHRSTSAWRCIAEPWMPCNTSAAWLGAVLKNTLGMASANARACLLASHGRGRQRRRARGKAAEAAQQREQRRPACAVAGTAGAAALARERPRSAHLRVCWWVLLRFCPLCRDPGCNHRAGAASACVRFQQLASVDWPHAHTDQPDLCRPAEKAYIMRPRRHTAGAPALQLPTARRWRFWPRGHP